MNMVSFLGSTVASGAAVPQVVSNANPLPVTLSGGLTGLQVSGVTAPGVIPTTNPVLVGGVDGTGAVRDLLTNGAGRLQVDVVTGGGSSNVSGTVAAGGAIAAQFPVTVGGIDGGGLARQLLTDVTGTLQIAGAVQQGAGNVANPWTMQGPVATGAAASGNPVPFGGISNTTPPTLASGQRAEAQLDSNANVRVRLVATQSSGADAASNNGLANLIQPNGSSPLSAGLVVAGMKYNGLTWDRDYKPRTAFLLPSTAATNNAANIKTTPGTLLGSISWAYLTNAAAAYLKFFDTTGVPNPAAQNYLYIFPLGFAASGGGVFSFVLPHGLYFPTGIGVAITASPAQLDNTAIAAAQITALNVPFQ